MNRPNTPGEGEEGLGCLIPSDRRRVGSTGRGRADKRRGLTRRIRIGELTCDCSAFIPVDLGQYSTPSVPYTSLDVDISL